jgi:hypothetical protein
MPLSGIRTHDPNVRTIAENYDIANYYVLFVVLYEVGDRATRFSEK